MKNKTFFVVGMPASGKTSYITRLCIQLTSMKENTAYRLEGMELPGGLEFITDSIQAMNKYKEIARTLDNSFYNLVLPLISQNDDELALRIPDLSGEHYRKLIENRAISKKLYNELQQADQILFFINIDTMEKEERMKLGEATVAKIFHDDRKIGKNEEDEETRAKEKATQSQITDLLQIIMAFVKGQLNIKFVISAWDSMEIKYNNSNLTPEKCMQTELPLFYQFIICNADKINYQFFGVSAQGMSYIDQSIVDELLEENVDLDEKACIVMPNGEKFQDMSMLFCE